MKIEREDLAIRLIEERARTGFSQADFARKLDITREGLRLYESGQRGISAEFLAQAATMGMDVQYILTGVRSANLAQAEHTVQPTVRPVKVPGSNVVQLVGGDVNGGSVTMSGNTLNMISTPKHITRTVAEVKPGEQHITDEQAAKLTALVHEIVELETKIKKKPNSYRSVWAALNAYCKVTKYRLILLTDYAKAEKYLYQWMGRLNSMASAPVADNDTWRKRRYAYIKINTRNDEAWLKAYLRKNFKTESLSDISDDELDKTYRAVARRKRA